MTISIIEAFRQSLPLVCAACPDYDEPWTEKEICAFSLQCTIPSISAYLGRLEGEHHVVPDPKR